jgi:hypothetical protein
MKTIILSLIILLGCSSGFSQQQFISLPSPGNHTPVYAIENVSDLPDQVISIERDKSLTRVKFKGGKEESFDLSKKDDLDMFMKIFGVAQVDQRYQSTVELDSDIRVLSPFSEGKEIQAIRSDNGETTIEIIPEEVVKDRKKLLKWLKQYGMIYEE